MAKPSFTAISLFIAAAMAASAAALMPYARTPWDMVLPYDDPFRILEHSPVAIHKGLETLTVARSDWKETSAAHIFTVDVPGMKKEDVKIEIEENRVLRISGERTAEEEAEGEKWHRSELAIGKFWRQFRLPANADLDKIQARLENGVLRLLFRSWRRTGRSRRRSLTLRKKPTMAKMLGPPRVRCEVTFSLLRC